MKILVLNCGSSSIKYQFFSLENNALIAKGIVEKIGMKGSFLKHEKENGQKVMFEGEILDHKIGIEYILGVLSSAKHGCIKTLEEISAVGHRVVHGGELFTESKLVNEEVIDALEKYTELAPLHNPPNLKGIYGIRSLIPSIIPLCPNTPICMPFPMHCTKNTAYVGTDSMERVTVMFQQEPAKFWVFIPKD